MGPLGEQGRDVSAATPDEWRQIMLAGYIYIMYIHVGSGWPVISGTRGDGDIKILSSPSTSDRRGTLIAQAPLAILAPMCIISAIEFNDTVVLASPDIFTRLHRLFNTFSRPQLPRRAEIVCSQLFLRLLIFPFFFFSG